MRTRQAKDTVAGTVHGIDRLIRNVQTGRFERSLSALTAAGAQIVPGRGLDFLDPDGNQVEVVQYDQIQFTKAPEILRGMNLELGKTDAALAELREKGLAE